MLADELEQQVERPREVGEPHREPAGWRLGHRNDGLTHPGNLTHEALTSPATPALWRHGPVIDGAITYPYGAKPSRPYAEEGGGEEVQGR
ncbi:hypothetical protein GCM10009682_61200 [Luedemannella flava]|uniref:Uncharacterized protein n=1 Tax=Luedemannella flava TaxID=349316 RepID=A0ABP4YY96_9ACTN